MISKYIQLLILQGITIIVQFIMMWQISLRVIPSVYGQYMLYVSLVGLVTMTLVAWPNAALLRFGREEWNKTGHMGNSLGSRLFLYILGTVITVIVLAIFDSQVASFLKTKTTPFLWLTLGVLIIPLGEMFIYANQAIGKTQIYGITPLLNRLVLLVGICLIPIISVPTDWRYIVSWTLGGALVSALFAALSLQKNRME